MEQLSRSFALPTFPCGLRQPPRHLYLFLNRIYGSEHETCGLQQARRRNETLILILLERKEPDEEICKPAILSRDIKTLKKRCEATGGGAERESSEDSRGLVRPSGSKLESHPETVDPVTIVVTAR